MLGPKGPFCQSCGMPLNRDQLGGGTNADGSRTTEYCSHCFQDGRFTEPNISVDEMMAKVEGKLREMHLPRILARRFSRNIPTLRRWQRAPAGQAG
jgi:bisphosphoglycerate-independent phosphoglycerate mutase (AlkP superfamily)